MKKLAFPQGRVNHLWKKLPYFSANNPGGYHMSGCGEVVDISYLVENPTLRLCKKCEERSKQ